MNISCRLVVSTFLLVLGNMLLVLFANICNDVYTQVRELYLYVGTSSRKNVLVITINLPILICILRCSIKSHLTFNAFIVYPSCRCHFGLLTTLYTSSGVIVHASLWFVQLVVAMFQLCTLQVNDIQGEVCRDFLRGICERAGCRFYHPSQLDIDQVELCRDFLRGICHWSGCCFFHPSATTSTNAKAQHWKSSIVLTLHQIPRCAWMVSSGENVFFCCIWLLSCSWLSVLK